MPDPLLAYLDGDLLPLDQARISVLDHGLLYGSAIFEGVSVDDGRIYRLRQHMERFARSAAYIRVELPMSVAQMSQAALDVAAANGMRDGYLRPLLTRGSGPMGLSAVADIKTPTFMVIPQVRERLTDARRLESGLSACVLGTRRIPAQCVDPRVKSNNYLNLVLGKFETWDAGADVGVLLTPNGEVSECCGENLFVVSGSVLRTPPAHLVLDGITRRSVIDLFRGAGGVVREEPLFTFDLYTADEIFVTATLIEVAAVTSIDGRRIGTGSAGPVTRQLFSALRADMAATGEPVPYPDREPVPNADGDGAA